MDFGFDVDASALTGALDRLEAATDIEHDGPMREGVLAASDAYFAAMRARFAAASAHDGTWAEHAPSTVRRRGPNAPILNETGQLQESMERDAAGHILEVENDTVIEGTSDRTARFHQSGTSRLPSRPILIDPSGEVLDAMGQQIANAVSESIAQE